MFIRLTFFKKRSRYGREFRDLEDLGVVLTRRLECNHFVYEHLLFHSA